MSYIGSHPTGASVRNRIMTLVDRMPENLQLKLLQFLQTRLPRRIKGKVIIDKRTDFRRHCLVGVEYRIGGKAFSGFILDISAFGAFIESDTPFHIGEDAQLHFTLPRFSPSFKVRGSIVWSGSQGFGVKFLSLTPHQKSQIKTFAEEESRVYNIVS